jgi:signal transduction histidine kinase
MASDVPGVRPRVTIPEPPPEEVRASAGSPGQERLLSEISHELGNYFHKLYYWAEILREQRPAGADAEPAGLLEQTIRDLENFLKTALEFFRPISIVSMAMSVGELTKSLRALVVRHVEPAPLRWEADVADATATVAVDPGRFSFVVDGLVRRLRAAPDAGVTATVETQGPAGDAWYVFTLASRGPDRAVGVSVAATIEWAIIERVVELHGGSVDATATGGECTVRLRLPVRP